MLYKGQSIDAQFPEVKQPRESLTALERELLIQLGFFDSVEHSWVTEIGDYDEVKREFVIADEPYLQQFSSKERTRIQKERQFYRELRAQEHLDFQPNAYRRNDEKTDLIKTAAVGSQIYLSEAELTRSFGLGKSYLAHSKEFNEAQKRIKWQIKAYYQNSKKPAWWETIAVLRRANRHD